MMTMTTMLDINIHNDIDDGDGIGDDDDVDGYVVSSGDFNPWRSFCRAVCLRFWNLQIRPIPCLCYVITSINITHIIINVITRRSAFFVDLSLFASHLQLSISSPEPSSTRPALPSTGSFWSSPSLTSSARLPVSRWSWTVGNTPWWWCCWQERWWWWWGGGERRER